MNSISNQLQSTLQTLYSQLGSHDPLAKFGSASNVLHSHGLTPGLLQDLRHDLDGVVNGKNPDRIVQNLLEGLKKFLTSTHSASEKMATDVNASEYKAPMSFVMGEDGKAKQLPSSEVPFGVNKESNLPLDTATDHVVSDLKALLDAEAAGNDISSSLINLRSSLKQLLDNPALTNDPELLRNALRKSIEAQA